MAGVVEPSETEPHVAWWVLPVGELLEARRNTQLQAEFNMRVGVRPSMTDVAVKVKAYTQDGRISYYVGLRPGIRARYCQWVGSFRPVVRTATDLWGEDAHWWGKSGFAMVSDHEEGGFLRLGIALLVVAPNEGPPPLPGRIRIEDEIGNGSFGKVFNCVDTERSSGPELVAKVARADDSSLDFRIDAVLMQQLEGVGFTELVGFFRDATGAKPKDVLVMEKLHRNLESLRVDDNVGPKLRLSPETVIEVGLQLIDRLKSMHDMGIVHMDLKPENVMIGPGRGDVLYLIDFGLSRHFMVGGVHIPPKEGSLHGSARYCSIHAHKALFSRRADMESLAFLLIFLAIGKLPWQGLPGVSSRERYENILRTKLEVDKLHDHVRKKLTGNERLVDALIEMVKVCRNLAFEEQPDYGELRRQLEMAAPARLERIQTGLEAEVGPARNVPQLDWVDPADRRTGRLTRAASQHFKEPGPQAGSRATAQAIRAEPIASPAASPHVSPREAPALPEGVALLLEAPVLPEVAMPEAPAVPEAAMPEAAAPPPPAAASSEPPFSPPQRRGAGAEEEEAAEPAPPVAAPQPPPVAADSSGLEPAPEPSPERKAEEPAPLSHQLSSASVQEGERADVAHGGMAMSLEELKEERIWKSKGVAPHTREQYLADDVFDSLFGMSKADFNACPKWKRDAAKKKHNLF